MWKVLKTDDELNKYRFAVEKKIDVLLPLEYLKRSRVVACLNNRKEICGGFVLVLRAPFRVLESIPGAVNLPGGVKLDSVAEITGLWMSSRYARKHGSIGLWLRMLREIIRSRKRHFVYSYSLRKPQLGQIYSVVQPTVLFQGETKTLPGMESSDRESVEVFSLRNLPRSAMAAFEFLTKRVRPRQNNRVPSLAQTMQL